jgi:hypothetical protein
MIKTIHRTTGKLCRASLWTAFQRGFPRMKPRLLVNGEHSLGMYLCETGLMSDPTRTFQFFETIEQGKPIRGTCSVCSRLFIGEPNAGEQTDDVLLRMRADFDAHDCHEETRQMTARIVKAATKEKR